MKPSSTQRTKQSQISIESIECQYNNNDDDNTYTNISKLQNVHNPPSRRRLQSLGGSTGKVLWTTWKGELSDSSDFCVPVDTVSGWQHLCLATVGLLYVPRVGWLVFNSNFSTKKAISYHSSVLRQLWRDDHDEDEQLKQWKKLKTLMIMKNQNSSHELFCLKISRSWSNWCSKSLDVGWQWNRRVSPSQSDHWEQLATRVSANIRQFTGGF